MRPGQDAAAHRAGVVVEFHFHEGRAHPRHLARCLLGALEQCRSCANGPHPSIPSPNRPSGIAISRWPRKPRKAASAIAPMPPPASTIASILRIGLAVGSERPQQRAPERGCRRQRRHGYRSLLQQPDGAAAARLEVGERLHAARRIGRDRAQQFGKLMRRARIEPAVGAARQPRDLAERLLGDRVMALLEHERRHAEQTECAGRSAQIVDRLLHRIADQHQRLHLALLGLAPRMREHLADLGVTAAAVDLLHQRRELPRLRHPARGAAFGQAAESTPVARRARRSPPSRGTCRPAACTRCPTAAGGSWWRRAQRSAGRAGRRRPPGRAPSPVPRNASISREATQPALPGGSVDGGVCRGGHWPWADRCAHRCL